MPDRSWEHGLHQAIEVKEDCALSVQTAPLARISYQRFFRRYVRLAGMTGTAREVAGELRSVYGPRVVRVPTHRPTRRSSRPDRLYTRAEDRWAAVVERVRTLHDEGRPVLIGTRSVEASEILHGHLEAAGLSHRVLNARQDEDEAAIVAEAGQPGRITLATNMAGRGTDIRLGPGVAEAGGLAVIATERHESARIDRQLFGRCGRQGDPGSHETLLSLDDELFSLHGNPARVERARASAGPDGCVPESLAPSLVTAAQAAAERRHARIRADLLRLDEQHSQRLAFSGRPE
jgi:preprotein translocase subunit SecA